MSKRVSGSREQEDSERSVDADDHRQVMRSSRVPCPAGGPEDGQRGNGKDKYNANYL